mgnify:CR=1 FL=1
MQQDLAFEGADRQPDADFPRPLGHRDQHDVHDADAADEKADGGHRAEKPGHDRRGAGQRAGHLGHIADGEVVVLAGSDVAKLAQDLLGLGLNRADPAGVGDRYVDRADAGVARHPPVERAQRQDGDGVLVVAERRLAPGGERPDDLAAELADPQALADGRGAGE